MADLDLQVYTHGCYNAGVARTELFLYRERAAPVCRGEVGGSQNPQNKRNPTSLLTCPGDRSMPGLVERVEHVRAALGLPEPGAAGLLGVVGAAAELLGLQLVAGVPLPVHVSAIESELFGGGSSATFSPAAAAPSTPAAAPTAPRATSRSGKRPSSSSPTSLHRVHVHLRFQMLSRHSGEGSLVSGVLRDPQPFS